VVSSFAPYRRRVAAVALLVVVTAGVGVVNPLLVEVVFDDALFCDGCPDVGLLSWLVAAMVALPVMTGSLGIWQTYLTNALGQRVMQDLRNALYAHLQKMPLRFFTATRTGEIQSRLGNDVGGVQTVVTETASSILSNVVIMVSTVIAMLVLSWELTVLSLAMLPVFVWLTKRVGSARRTVSSSTQKTMAEMSALSQETLSVSGVLLSKTFGRQREEIARFREQNAELAGLQIRQQMIGRSFFALVQVFFSVTPALVYLVAGLVIARDGATAISAGTIVAFTTLQSRLFFPIGQMLEVSVQVQSSLALFERIYEYLDLTHEITDAPDARDLPPDTRGAISFRDVSFHYETAPAEAPRRGALEHVSLEIAPGRLAAVVGPSGAGKTTLSYLIPRLYDVTGGAVCIDGIDVRRLTLASLARAIGVVTQETYLFHTSIRTNLLYGDPGATQDQLEAAARAANIHDRIAECPTATTPWSGSEATGCPAARSSVSRSRGSFSPTRASSSWTRRRPRWTRSTSGCCRTRSRPSWRAVPRSRSRTASRRSSPPTSSSCSTADGSSSRERTPSCWSTTGPTRGSTRSSSAAGPSRPAARTASCCARARSCRPAELVAPARNRRRAGRRCAPRLRV
jgi:ATP-binding cassette subfamily B protein